MSKVRCVECGDIFKSEQGMKTHHTMKHKNDDYKDCEKLKELYIERGLGFEKISKLFDVSPQAIETSVKKCDINTRKPDDEKPAAYTVVESGHPRWETVHGDEHHSVQVHRLLAVCEYGFDAIKGKVVHHKNGVPWDNRAKNIKPMTHGEHTSHHRKIYNQEKRNEIAKDFVESELTQREYAKEVDFSRGTLREMVNEYKNE